jgi:hypothetical protein
MLKRGFRCALNIGPWLIFWMHIQMRYNSKFLIPSPPFKQHLYNLNDSELSCKVSTILFQILNPSTFSHDNLTLSNA